MYVLLIVYLYRVIISTIVDDIFGLKSTCTTIGIFALFMHDNFKRCFLWLRGHCVCATVHTRVCVQCTRRPNVMSMAKWAGLIYIM